MDRRELVKSALASGAGVLSAGLASQPQAAAAATDPSLPRVVYHLSEIGKVQFVLGNIRNHIEGMGGADKVRLALVVHGPPLASFVAEVAASTVRSETSRFKNLGVDLYACIHTMAAINIKLAALLPGFQVADKGGVVKLAQLQAEGWAYLRP